VLIWLVKRGRAAVLLIACGAAAVGALTVEGRALRLEGGALVAADADWLSARARYLLDTKEYGRANDLATLLATLTPADGKLAAQALAARTKYFAVGHKEAYAAFRDLYKAELARRGSPPAAVADLPPASKEDVARLAVISTEAIGALATGYTTAAVSATKRISTYDSPTANTGIAEPQTTRYDLRWSVNLFFLIRDYDKASADGARTALRSIIDEKRVYNAVFRDVSMPKSTPTRALDEVKGSATTRARKMLPGAFAREIQNTYNLEGFKFCITKPVDAAELTLYAARIMELSATPEYKVEQSNDEGYVAYLGNATCRASATASLADLLKYFGVDPYAWRSFVGDLEKKEEPPKKAEEPPPEAGMDAGGIPEGP